MRVPGFRISADNVRATVDGSRIDASRISVAGSRIRVASPHLREGRHTATVAIRNVGVLRRDDQMSWSFNVDTVVPRVRMVTKPSSDTGMYQSDRRSLELTLRTEGGARVHFSTASTHHSAQADADGRVIAAVPLGEGRQSLHIRAVDAAGNARARTLPVVVDSLDPIVHVAVPATLTTASWTGSAFASDASKLTTRFTIDARGSETVRKGRTARHMWSIGTQHDLSEGIHTFAFEARDAFDHTTVVTRRVLVDSTEELGANSMGFGARGADVRDLQRALESKHLFTTSTAAARREWRRQVYGTATASAVRSYQHRHGLTPDGVAGQETVAAMTLRIEISRSANTLTLFRLGRIVRTFHVATGSATYPTPAGSYHIVNMQKNPTWTPPPDSEWAKGAKPIPPGPDNPLGTRWMGLNAPNVGIHGTNNPASIGYSVSHGCIRMAIPDVEALYELVTPGTPVVIR